MEKYERESCHALLEFIYVKKPHKFSLQYPQYNTVYQIYIFTNAIDCSLDVDSTTIFQLAT